MTNKDYYYSSIISLLILHRDINFISVVTKTYIVKTLEIFSLIGLSIENIKL